MARLNEDAQWIILLGLIISISIFFLALIVNEATLVGQTTAESVLELPKSDIQDLRNQILRITNIGNFSGSIEQDIRDLNVNPKTVVVTITAPYERIPKSGDTITIHFNNGVTNLSETIYY